MAASSMMAWAENGVRTTVEASQVSARCLVGRQQGLRREETTACPSDTRSCLVPVRGGSLLRDNGPILRPFFMSMTANAARRNLDKLRGAHDVPHHWPSSHLDWAQDSCFIYFFPLPPSNPSSTPLRWTSWPGAEWN
jgi:hypothetical protein